MTTTELKQIKDKLVTSDCPTATKILESIKDKETKSITK